MFTSRRSLAVAVVGLMTSTAHAASTLLLIDSEALPGTSFVFTFKPKDDGDGGVRLIGARETVRTTALVQLDEMLPVFWMATFARSGDVAPNQMAHALSSPEDSFTLRYSQDMAIVYANGQWHLPKYDSRVFTVDVGFGFKADVLSWAYSVRCQPGQVLTMLPGAYQVVRSDGENQQGTPVPDRESWSLAIGSRSVLTMDSYGNGSLKSLP